jgi:hypothetical protein
VLAGRRRAAAAQPKKERRRSRARAANGGADEVPQRLVILVDFLVKLRCTCRRREELYYEARVRSVIVASGLSAWVWVVCSWWRGGAIYNPASGVMSLQLANHGEGYTDRTRVQLSVWDEHGDILQV